MKEIPLSGKRAAGLIALIDDEDIDIVSQRKWNLQVTSGSSVYYAAATFSYQRVLMHHLVFGKPEHGMVTDHRDGNGLNNQKCNLRFVTTQQNMWSTHAVRGASRFKGVSPSHCGRKKWKAQIRIGRTTKVIGYFHTEEEAAIAYDRVALAMRGEFASVNGEKVFQKVQITVDTG